MIPEVKTMNALLLFLAIICTKVCFGLPQERGVTQSYKEFHSKTGAPNHHQNTQPDFRNQGFTEPTNTPTDQQHGDNDVTNGLSNLGRRPGPTRSPKTTGNTQSFNTNQVNFRNGRAQQTGSTDFGFTSPGAEDQNEVTGFTNLPTTRFDPKHSSYPSHHSTNQFRNQEDSGLNTRINTNLPGTDAIPTNFPPTSDFLEDTTDAVTTDDYGVNGTKDMYMKVTNKMADVGEDGTDFLEPRGQDNSVEDVKKRSDGSSLDPGPIDGSKKANITDIQERGNLKNRHGSGPDTLPAVFRPEDPWRWAPDTPRPRFPGSNFVDPLRRPTSQFGQNQFQRPNFNQRPRPFDQIPPTNFNQGFGNNQQSNFNQGGQNQHPNVGLGRPDINGQRGFLMAGNMTRAVNVNADCMSDIMMINVRFNGSFNGLIYSSGYVHDTNCVYINGTGATFYKFPIKMNSCGTLARTNDINPRPSNPEEKNGLKTTSNSYRWNTISVQYNPMIEEEWDQHFKVTCEMGQEYWKTVSFPVLDVNVATGNPLLFTTQPPECFMEIKQGFSVNGPRISGAVTVGDPLTLIVYMRSSTDGFDISVNNCHAHNGANKRISLINRQGCPSQDKLISAFQGHSSQGTVHQTALSAFFKAFRFTGSPALYIECDVHMCKGTCPDQQCNWRNKKTLRLKRSSEDGKDVSEKINLSRSLEVRQEKDEESGPSINLKGEKVNEDSTICMTGVAFTTTVAILSIILVISSIISMSLCIRHKTMKKDSSIVKVAAQKSGFVRSPMTGFS